MESIYGSLNNDGFHFVPSLLKGDVCSQLANALGVSAANKNARHLVDHPAVRELIQSPSISHHIKTLLGAEAFQFKATLFDKSCESNWLVAWHQDLSIPVVGRIDVAGYTGWSIKDGVQYVQPPSLFLTTSSRYEFILTTVMLRMEHYTFWLVVICMAEYHKQKLFIA